MSDTLDQQRFNAFDGTLAGSFTAHPHLDPLTGEHHAICYEATNPNEIRHVVLDQKGSVIREEAVAVEHGPSIHDCAITARYAIILDLPVTFSMKALVGGHTFPYQWNTGHQARVGLMPRDGSAKDIIWCEVDPVYVFHVANAFDMDDGRVRLDVCAYPTMFASSLQGPVDPSRGFERWTIDPTTRKVSIETVDASPQEFPRIDERRFGQTYRFAYTMALPAKDTEQFSGETKLYKHDLETGTRLTHEFGPGRHPGEFVFVPASKTSAEDEGWMIGLVIDLPNQTTDLAIIDSRNFEAAPVASIRIPHRVPPGFHGNWIAQQGA
jgi:carotenoid cleavage dioxygenase